MKKFFTAVSVALFCIFTASNLSAQGDVRSATGLPIPIGQPAIWGQIELKGLRPNEPRPTIIVTLMNGGAQTARAQANDQGYYYFLGRPGDGFSLLVTVGGVDVGSLVLTSAGGSRYDMVLNWQENLRPQQRTGVISANSLYPERSAANSTLVDKAQQAAKNKNRAEAITIYEQVVTADPKDFVAWVELGTLQFEDSKLPAAERSYKTALELKPDLRVAQMNLGKLYIAQQKFGVAAETLEKFVAAEPNSADGFHFLGEAYLQNKQGSKAVPALNEAIRLAPIEKAEIHLRLANLYNAANLKDRAVAEYQQFLQKVPNHPEKAKLEKYIKDNSK